MVEPYVFLSDKIVYRYYGKLSDHRPILSDFANKELPNYFDNVTFIYRDEYYDYETEDKGIAEIITARNKYGSRGVVKLAWIPEYQKFCNMEKLGG